MDERGTKRYAEEEPCPEDGRFGQTPAMAMMVSVAQRVVALTAERDEARAALKVAELSVSRSNELTLKLMKRVLTAEGRAKTASKAQKDAEALLADSSLQLREAHSRAALSMNRESAVRKELDAKEISIATATECPVCYSQANVPGHEPYRLGCLDGHQLCYECIYIMFLRPNKPGQECPHCRGLLNRPPYLDRVTLSLIQTLLPAHSPSENDLITTAPRDSGWISLMKWPPTPPAARSIRRRLEKQRIPNVTPAPSVVVLRNDDDASGETAI